MSGAPWGRPGSTSPDAWPDTYVVEQPEAAHAASEIVDDAPELMGGAVVAALAVGIFTLGVALVGWAVITHW